MGIRGGFEGAVNRAYRIPYRWVPKKLLQDKDDILSYDVCQ